MLVVLIGIWFISSSIAEVDVPATLFVLYDLDPVMDI
jgi:hypothetical protein